MEVERNCTGLLRPWSILSRRHLSSGTKGTALSLSAGSSRSCKNAWLTSPKITYWPNLNRSKTLNTFGSRLGPISRTSLRDGNSFSWKERHRQFCTWSCHVLSFYRVVWQVVCCALWTSGGLFLHAPAQCSTAYFSHMAYSLWHNLLCKVWNRLSAWARLSCRAVRSFGRETNFLPHSIRREAWNCLRSPVCLVLIVIWLCIIDTDRLEVPKVSH